MLLDNQNLFCENQVITANAYSQNVIAFGKNDVSFVPVVVQVVEDFASLESLEVTFETSESPNFATVVELASATLLASELKAGKTFPITFLPRGNKGYMRLSFAVSGTATAGKITSGVVAGNGLSSHEV